MIAALIDLHVRPNQAEQESQELETLATSARDRGLDGIVVVGADQALNLGDTGALVQATGVQVFAGVELLSDLGRLVCYPRELDAWWQQAGWQQLADSNGAGPATYRAADVVQAFAERGGAVVIVPDAEHPADRLEAAQGLSAVVVTAGEPVVDEQSVQAAQIARIACVAGSACGPENARFGAVATIFAAPPTSQDAMVDGLRSGRVWPVEIGSPWIANRATPSARKSGSADDRSEAAPAAPAAPAATKADRKAAAGGKAKGRYDGHERPGDNRGNRLHLDEMRRKMAFSGDETQPQFDPVAAMYGLESRRIRQNANKSDDELDRINGNRARGADTNVMLMPSFAELRNERQAVQVLFASTEEDDRVEDSIALRFALANMGQTLHGLEQGARHIGHDPAGGNRRRGRRRR